MRVNILLAFGMALLAGCAGPTTSRVTPLPGNLALSLGASVRGDANIKLAVLAYMVEEVDTSGELVRFIDLGPQEMEQLRLLSEPRFEIAHLSEAELMEDGYHLKNSAKRGIKLRFGKVGKIQGTNAEAYGSCHLGTGFGSAGFRYTLRYENGVWRVVGSKGIIAT